MVLKALGASHATAFGTENTCTAEVLAKAQSYFESVSLDAGGKIRTSVYATKCNELILGVQTGIAANGPLAWPNLCQEILEKGQCIVVALDQ